MTSLRAAGETVAAGASGPASPTLARSPLQGSTPHPFPPLPIPTPRITFYNVNGLSGEATDGASKARQARVLQNVQALARSSQFLGLQDTRCRESSPVFASLLPTTHTTFHNPNPDSLHCGGTAVLVPKSLLPQYHISHRIGSKRWTSALGTRTTRVSPCSTCTSNPTTKPWQSPPFPPSRTPRKASPTSSCSATGI